MSEQKPRPSNKLLSSLFSVFQFEFCFSLLGITPLLQGQFSVVSYSSYLISETSWNTEQQITNTKTTFPEHVFPQLPLL